LFPVIEDYKVTILQGFASVESIGSTPLHPRYSYGPEVEEYAVNYLLTNLRF